MANPNILLPTHEVLRFRETRPKIQKADWLTHPLVEAGILPKEFKGSRIAPVVVGLSTESITRNGKEIDKTLRLKSAADVDYLLIPPSRDFNPHNILKNRVRVALESESRAKKPAITLFPGYVFPDIANGSVFLDNTLSDGTCTPETLRPAADVLATVMGLGVVTVGSEVLVMNDYGFTPDLPIPSVIRQALGPVDKSGKIDGSTKSFISAANMIRAIR